MPRASSGLTRCGFASRRNGRSGRSRPGLLVRKLFLPGAGASASFWRPVAERLPAEWACERLSWPGLGAEPHDAAVRSIDEAVSLVLASSPEPVDLVAQSMGGLVALKVALRAPRLVRRLVLTGTSGGLPVEAFGGIDWRAQYRRDYPDALSWIMDIREDLSDQLHTIRAPTLLIWGEVDRVSPVGVGRELQLRLPNAALTIVAGGDHDFPETHPRETAKLLRQHLEGG